MKKLKAGIIGLGQRGMGYLDYVLLDMEEIDIVAVCDTVEERSIQAKEMAINKGHNTSSYINSDDLFNNESLDCVFIMTPWVSHISLSIEAMNRGIPVAMEVGGSYDLEELWELVRAYESTKTPIMMLENCCYGRLEMMTMNMVNQGVLGEIVHVSGGYLHDLRDEISEGRYRKHYRLDDYIKRNTENYPTHEIGPLAQILKINRGNRFLTLSSFASKSRGLEEYLLNNGSEKNEGAKNKRFNQADVVITNIKCANGELVTIKLDTTLPRYYSRAFYVQGTKGLVNEENNSIFLEEDTSQKDHFNWNKNYNNVEKYYEKYEHPVWKKYLEDGVKMGHGGMDYLVVKAFIDALNNKDEMPIDVYDAAAWMAITTLSEQSIALGGQQVYFPDFTKGKWIFEK